MDTLLEFLFKFTLRLRYRIKVTGLDKIIARGQKSILFLPNHPALIDPVIMLSVLHKDFAPRSIASEFRIDRPIIGWLSKRFGARPIPDMAREGSEAAKGIRNVLSKSITGLSNGENLLLYPAGHLKRSYLEKLGATSAVDVILGNIPDVRVVLVRQNGLWGSSFSWASGKSPDFITNLKRHLKYLLLNGLFFMPRRPVEIEFVEPENFPRGADRVTTNRFMEDFYNAGAWHNTYVPYLFWEKGGIRARPEPEYVKIEGDTGSMPETTRKLVLRHFEQITGRTDLNENHRLAYDLGLDSLAIAEVILWLEKEFGFPPVDTDSLTTVGDVMLTAIGKGISSDLAQLKSVSPKWFVESSENRPLTLPEGNAITEVFLNQAKRNPGKVIIADQLSGEKTYRDIITAIMALKPLIEKLPGAHAGIMLPASAGANIVYLATLFAGKTPVMVNWTVGSRNMAHSLNLIGVRHVLTAKALAGRLKAQGINLDEISNRFVFMEDFRKKISFASKLWAYCRSHLSWSSLEHAKITDTAVILFTSGSETLPKAVPLSHENIMANIRDIPMMATIRENDVMIGMLPPFHSFGITTTMVLPLCMGLRTAYHPNPTEAPTIARLIKRYKVSLMVGTPTFLNGIMLASSKEQLDTLRLAISGAEKCPNSVYKVINERCPHVKLLEGYGVTECSPIVSANPEDSPKPYTIGKVLPSFEHVIIDVESGERVGKNKVGMLLVRGPSVFSGYLNYDGEPPFVEYDGKQWYRTGDLVTEDNNGVLTFCGRLKRFIKLGGEMISLPAIEDVLLPHFISDKDEGPVIAVESTPSEESPELALFTVKETDRATVNNYIREAGLSALHNIRQVIKLKEIPVLGTGKIDYRALKGRLKGGNSSV
ncbi:MAG: AMP-binding protein [Pseudomonadota bacterium]